mmetsp:Transcript_39492/g.123557  ORF Transcript_39492/g.123557 Transcript_39492/m.123557 type:complete len:233 (-) Transcript_39492:69-767(-)
MRLRPPRGPAPVWPLWLATARMSASGASSVSPLPFAAAAASSPTRARRSASRKLSRWMQSNSPTGAKVVSVAVDADGAGVVLYVRSRVVTIQSSTTGKVSASARRPGLTYSAKRDASPPMSLARAARRSVGLSGLRTLAPKRYRALDAKRLTPPLSNVARICIVESRSWARTHSMMRCLSAPPPSASISSVTSRLALRINVNIALCDHIVPSHSPGPASRTPPARLASTTSL